MKPMSSDTWKRVPVMMRVVKETELVINFDRYKMQKNMKYHYIYALSL